MINSENRHITTNRHGLRWALVAGAVALALVATGVHYSTGRWNADATSTSDRTYDAQQVPRPGAGPSAPGIPHSGGR